MLPKVAQSTASVTIEGTKVSVRGLTRGENAQVSRLIDAKKLEEAEILILHFGTDNPVEEIEAWYDDTNSGVVNSVLEAIQSLTGLSAEASKSST